MPKQPHAYVTQHAFVSFVQKAIHMAAKAVRSLEQSTACNHDHAAPRHAPDKGPKKPIKKGKVQG